MKKKHLTVRNQILFYIRHHFIEEFQPDFFNLQITVMFFNLLVLFISRWIHAKCEGLDGEQYQVLSLLPDTVEYVCR